MNPIQFGRSGMMLNGIYHPPKASVARDAAVLICPPIGQEYMRTHWSIRQLALRLAEAGMHVLRFDYLGTGDSAGDMGDAVLDIWADDVQLALTELTELSGVTAPTVVGVRFGALVSAVASARKLLETPRLVFWDPVVHGGEYLASLAHLHAYIVRVARFFPPISSDELVGFRYPYRIRREIEALDLEQLVSGVGATTIDVLTTEKRPDYARLRDSIKKSGKVGNFMYIADAGSWDVPEVARAAMLAVPTINALFALVSGMPNNGVP